MLKPAVLGIALAATAAVTAGAQQYPSFAPYPLYASPGSHPPSWSYDPYTSGIAGCVQYSPKNPLPCGELMPPSYGQPNYWTPYP